ncbi:MAG: hypothetical protein H0V93_00015 [Euzebyales bacterium]|nr:hypothetical protein [Euzebyales bacterium]
MTLNEETTRLGGERGSQAAEFAMVLPMAIGLLGFLLAAALVGVELLAAQHLAREVARAAAVTSDADAHTMAGQLAEGRTLELAVSPPSGARRPGDLLTVRLRLRSAVAARLGVDVWLPATAVMRTEDVP